MLILRDDIAFSAVVVQPPEVHGLEAEHESELEFLALEEIRFIGCIGLALHPERGMVYPYPLQIHVDLPLMRIRAGSIDAWNPEALVAQARILAASISSDDYRRRAAVLPPILGGPSWNTHQERLDLKLLRGMLENIAPDDWLPLRGLGALLRADMLWQHREFGEHAVMALHVAMEASFQLTRDLLEEFGVKNPTALDCGNYIDRIFGFKGGHPYFKGWYDDRIICSHPSNRYGIYPFPPLSADDFYDLRPNLHSVFVYMITGVTERL